jgi:UDP-N-acetylmuramoylalanine--D-glutamate ligase
MRITDLAYKKICILGYGKEGQAMLKALQQYAPTAEITIADKNPLLQPTNYKLQTGSNYLKNLRDFDIIIKSPGIPHQPEFDAVQKKMTSSTQIFLESIEGSGAMTIGVTGSKGKSTTSTLIFQILGAAGKNVSLIGNIGEPSISHLDEAKPEKIFVMEMSSYQLQDLSVSPHIAVVTSFFPEHLDYHGSIDAYKNAKKNIAKHQKNDDVIFYCATSDGAREIALESPGTRVPFAADESPVTMEQTKLLGEHNRSNIAAVWKVGEHLKIAPDVMLDVIKNFQGLPHRLQSLGVHAGIEWVDDAISTTPESAIAALDALGERVATIILGGQDRGNDFSQLAKRIKNSSVKTVILFPGTGPRIREAIGDAHADVCFHEVDSMEKAVEIAKNQTPKTTNYKLQPSIVLLSTASPSYNMFKNFEENDRRL